MKCTLSNVFLHITAVYSGLHQHQLLDGSSWVGSCLSKILLPCSKCGVVYQIFKRVHDSIAELGLESVADNQVGGSHGIRGVSGGERRRVTIGMEMVTRPTIILMDEPTSGLDSHTALSLMTLLKRISQHGRLIVLSVHQPTPVCPIVSTCFGRQSNQLNPSIPAARLTQSSSDSSGERNENTCMSLDQH